MAQETAATEKQNAPHDITLKAAVNIVDAAITKAEAIDTKMDIAVVDAGGNLKAFVRMDGAWLGSIDIAQKKARTARYFDMPTGEIGKLSQPGGPLYQIEGSNDGLITFPGGLPLKNASGEIIGAIGVSGSTVENDHTVAQAGVDAFGK
ncbi:MAG: heme-binding protein [FCB group bacterium]|nr:heme-binding protein [FCB group bacterium]